MNRDRALAIVASTGMILTWLANVATPRPEPAGDVPPQGRARVTVPAETANALAFDVEREAERLRARVAAAPGPRRSGRDPFRFGQASAAPPIQPRAHRIEVPLETPAPEPPAAPRFDLKLIGVAERATTDGTIRSAVLSGPSDVFIVAVGDRVLDRYVVTAIGADVVELQDDGGAAPLRLALK